MAKTQGEARADRLQEMLELYVQRAYSDIELAERLKVNRETVFKDRQLLMAKHSFEEVERGRWKIKRKSFLSNIGLTPLQSVPLYLFARKSTRQLGIAQKYVAEANEKLALCIKKPMAERLTHAADIVLQLPVADEPLRIFECVVEAWLEDRRIDIDYVRLGGNRAVRHTLDPYLIEPSVWSDAVYVIGWSEPDHQVMAFKLDRITYAFVRGDSFRLREDFDENDLLKRAWGVWDSDGETTTVRLRFSEPAAIQRLKETRWHPLQEPLQEQADGSCIWSAPVAEWREMLPWIRGWGSACEVLDPKPLRETLMGEAKAMAERYGWHVSSQPAHTAPSVLDDFFGGQS